MTTARVTIVRDHPDDVQDRPVRLWLDGERQENLAYGRENATQAQLEAARQLPHSVWLRKAEELIRAGKVPNRWDAVIVDEVQDLAPAALRFLSALAAKEPGNFLLVGDGGVSHGWLRLHDRCGRSLTVLHCRYLGRLLARAPNHRAHRA